jgi:hypothetical protein
MTDEEPNVTVCSATKTLANACIAYFLLVFNDSTFMQARGIPCRALSEPYRFSALPKRVA